MIGDYDSTKEGAKGEAYVIAQANVLITFNPSLIVSLIFIEYM
jgi:hypothetical protein